MISTNRAKIDCAQLDSGQTVQAERLLTGRILIATGEELSFVPRDMTVQSAKIFQVAGVEPGQTAGCYLDQIGIIPRKIKFLTQSGFVIAFSIKWSRRGQVTT